MKGPLLRRRRGTPSRVVGWRAAVVETPWIVADELWRRIEPLLPPRPPRRYRYPGRKPLSDRAALSGILYVLHTGVAWDHLPRELGFGAGITCWKRLDAWTRAGVWERLHALLIAELCDADAIEWRRTIVDSSHVQAKKGAPRRARARSTAVAGSKHHLIVDGHGTPLSWSVTGGNRNDVTQLVPL